MYELRTDILLVAEEPELIGLVTETKPSTGCADRAVQHVRGDGVLEYLRQAQEHKPRARPRLILLDLDLPHREGWTLLAEIKSDDRLKRIPVVVLTASAEDEDIRNAYDLGANCYVTRPSDEQALREAVRGIEEYWLHTANLPRV